VPSSLHSLPQPKRDAIASALIVLFNLRAIADYLPAVAVDVATVKTAHSLHDRITALLEE